MDSYSVDKLSVKEMAPGIRLKAVHLDKLTVTFVELDEDAVLPEHSHPHEQISYIAKGTLRLVVDGVPHDLPAGTGITIPSGVPHSATVVAGPVLAIDSFSPKREDYVF